MAEIGYRLIRAREARGLTLEDAERDTRISRRYLEALEDEQFEVIPAPVYARGFLRSYAQYLGMDPQEILALFPRGEEQARSANGASASRASMDSPIPSTSPSRPTWRKPPRFDSGKTARSEPRNRRREPPPPLRGATGEVMIGGDPIPTQPLPRAAGPNLDVKAPPGRRPPARTVVSDAVIGQDIHQQPKRGPSGSTSDRQRNLIVVGATAAAVLVVGIAAFLIATLGGDDETPGGATDPSSTPGQTQDASPGTGTAQATETGTEGAQQGLVPAIIGETEAAAVDAIEAAGLQARVIQATSPEPEGTVVDQSPAAGSQLGSGAEVRIVVSTGQ